MTRTEVRWFGAVSLATLLLVEAVYLLAYAQQARGFLFLGMLWSPHDFPQYAAAMRDGAGSSSWLIHDRLTTEPHRPILMYPFYVGLGKLAGLLGLDFQVAFRAAALAARSVLLVALYVFSCAVFSTIDGRRRAFLLIVFSSGLGFWLLIVDLAVPFMGDRRALLTLDLQLPDVSTFLALFLAPHNMLGLALSLLAGRVYLASWSRHGRSLPLLVGLMVLGLGAVHPFSLVTLCVVISAHLVLTWLREGCIPGATLWCVAAVFLAAGPFLVYSWLIFSADPFWGVAYGQQNITPSPPPAFLALALAPILILAAVGLPSFLRGATRERTLVVTWILVSLASMYAPVGYQRRFAFGVHPMLALVAVAGAGRIWAVARGNGEGPSRRHPLLSLTVFLALFASTTYSYGIRVQMASRPEELVRQAGAFHPVSLVDAAQWLTTAMEPGDAILSEALTGNYLATVVPGRVFLGHPIATLNFGQKEITVRRFYLRADDPDATLQLLNSNGVRYVVYGPYERAVVASQPPSRPYLRLAYATPDVLIFEVLRDGGVEEQADGDQ